MHIKENFLGMIFVFSMATLLLACSPQPSATILTKTPPAITQNTLVSSSTPLPAPSFAPPPLAPPTGTPTIIVQVASLTPPPLNSILDVTPSVTSAQTVAAISPPMIMTHTTTGIHLSLQMCEETEHFVLHCIDVDKVVSAIIASQLEYEFERITTHLNHRPSEKINVEIYPNLQSFHAAVDHQSGFEWFVGKAESGTIRMVTPLNPGPKHTFDTILTTAVHEFTHLIIDEITNHALPAWLDEGIAVYESGQRQPQVIAARIDESLPNIADLNFNSGTDSSTIYAFSYTVIEFIVQEFGYDYLVKLVANEGNFEEVLNMPEMEFEQAWLEFIVAEYSEFRGD